MHTLAMRLNWSIHFVCVFSFGLYKLSLDGVYLAHQLQSCESLAGIPATFGMVSGIKDEDASIKPIFLPQRYHDMHKTTRSNFRL